MGIKGKFMQWTKVAALIALLMGAPVAYANVLITGVAVTPNHFALRTQLLGLYSHALEQSRATKAQ
jgi:hypothetical protein